MKYEIMQARSIHILIILISTSIITRRSIKLIISLLKDAECTKINYNNKKVIAGAGIAFIPVILIMSVLCIFIFQSQYIIYSSYILGVCAVGFAGILDDLIGEKNIKGLVNHFCSFLHGHLTTGFFKALIGGFTSIIISIGISNGILDFFLNIFNIALFTNTLNLMDLRPGRCVKVFLIVGSIIFILNIRYIAPFLPLGIALVMASVYLIYDLKEVCMLGDVGSNILGITLGYYSSLNSNLAVKMILVLILLIINIAAEKVSFTNIIAKNKFLSYLDSIGRSS